MGPTTRVSSQSAVIADDHEVDRLLAAVPYGEKIRDRLGERLLFQHWDDAGQRAIWVSSDGDVARCVMVSGLSPQEMAGIWIGFNERLERASFHLSAQLVRDIIETEMDASVVLVH